MRGVSVLFLCFVLMFSFALAQTGGNYGSETDSFSVSYSSDTGEAVYHYGNKVYSYGHLNDSLLEELEDYNATLAEMEAKAQRIIDEARNDIESYREEIEQMRTEFENDREEFTRRRNEMIYEINNGNLTREERMALIEELSGVRQEIRTEFRSLIDEGRALRVEFRGELLNFSNRFNGSFIGQRFKMRNGEDFEINVDPSEVMDRAMSRVKLRMCDESNDCSMNLREFIRDKISRVAYSVNAQQPGKLFGFIKTNMNVQVDVDAGNGDVINVKTPWWSFMFSGN